MTILLTGFEPFLEFRENPSKLVAEELDGRTLGGHKVIGIVLPVDYTKVEDALTSAIEESHPVLVLGLGLAPGRQKITPEKIAINYKFFEQPDNAGHVTLGEPIDSSQPAGLFTNLPVEGLVEKLRLAKIPAGLSFSAGAYLCNMAMFVTVREALRKGFGGGFTHIPCHESLVLESEKDHPSMSLETIIRSVELSLRYYSANTRWMPQPMALPNRRTSGANR